MDLKERIYSVLVVSAAPKINSALSTLLTESHNSPVRFVSNVSAAKRAFSEQSYDFIIINSPLTDGDGTRFAIDAAHSNGSVVLLIVHSDIYADIQEKVLDHGVFTLSKPTNHTMLAMALDWMSAARERLRQSEKKSISVEEKMEEIRLVNRAKWLLIEELKLDEPHAHRYIEKQAMDRCISRRKIAEEIIQKYK